MDYFDRIYQGTNKIRRAYLGGIDNPIWEAPAPIYTGGATVATNQALDPFYTAGRSVAGAVRPMTNRFAGGTSGAYTFITDATDGPDGITSYARFTVGSSTGSGRGFHIVGNPETTTPSSTDFTPINPDDPMVLSVYSRYDGGAAMRLTVRWISAPGVWLNPAASWTSTAPIAQNQWFRHSVGGNAPAGVIGFNAYVTLQGTAISGRTIDATGLLFLNDSSTLIPVFAGNTPDDLVPPGFAYDWAGTEFVSSSTKKTLVEYP